MELRHLNYFIAVAEELHFGHAAARLRMAQPPLSAQIRKLEEELGVLLFERSNRRQVTLTPGGQAFLREARRVLQQVEQATLAAQRAARGLEGELAIGFVGSVTFDIFPRILQAFRARFPHVQLSLHELKSSEQLQRLRQERLQVGIVRPTGSANGVELAQLLDEPLMAVLPETHRLAAREEIALEELVREPLILSPADGCGILYDLVTAECRKLGLKPNIAQEATEIQIRVGLVSSGLGVTLMPQAVQSFQRRGVVYRHLKAPAPRIELSLAWREGDRSALVQSFVDVARETVVAPPLRETPSLRVIPKTS
jgi:DNA-binding transcriptional LysR family regulator